MSETPATVGLPVIQRPVDNTAISAYMTCPREYFFGMVLHRRASGKASPPLAYGKMWHRLMEVHYRSGGNQTLVRAILDKEWPAMDHGVIDDYRTGERCWLDYLAYIKKYGSDPKKEQGTTLGWPNDPLVEISAQVLVPGMIHPYTVKIDRVIELGGLHYIEDHKTTSRLDKHFFSSFENDNQMKGYVATASALFPSLRIVGARINVNHVLTKSSNFERGLVTYSPDIIKEWKENTNLWISRLAGDSAEWESLMAAGHQPNPIGHYGTNGCNRKYGLCSYHRVCSSAPRLRQRVLESEFEINEWNPLEVDSDE